MRSRLLRRIVHATLTVALLAPAACGTSGDTEKKAAVTARPVASGLDLESAPMKEAMEAAGYRPVFFRRFPAQVPGMKASVVVYRAKSGKDGGVVYLQEYGETDREVWHWYFESEAPDSVAPVEINGDGLWDVRMYVGGEARDYVQDQSFTFVRSQRNDRVAMNGASSEPNDAESMSWLCFDGDTTTAWRSKVGPGGAFIVLPVPLGMDEGILSVRLGDADQKLECELQADGRKVQDFGLQPNDHEQLVHLSADAQKARSLRLVIKKGADDVAITELELR
jgi:hypothetical protein